MDKKLIQVGKVYLAKHAGQLVKVRVDDIRVIEGVKIFNRPSLTRYYCTKLKTNRQVIFKSAQKFKMFDIEKPIEQKGVEPKTEPKA